MILYCSENKLDLAQQVMAAKAWKKWKLGNCLSNFWVLVIGSVMASIVLYRPELVYNIARQWTETEGTLQDFFERHMHNWLPCLTARSEIAFSASYALEWLAKNMALSLCFLNKIPLLDLILVIVA